MSTFLYAASSEANPRLDYSLREAKDYFFTYGTLMRGQSRGYLLQNHRFVGNAYARYCELFDTQCGFPTLQLRGGHDSLVYGELYEIPLNFFKLLDTIENGLYDRTGLLVVTEGEKPYMCQAYVGNCFDISKLPRIESGDWKVYANQHQHPRAAAREALATKPS